MNWSLQDDLFTLYLHKTDLTSNDKELDLLLYHLEHKES